MDPTIVQYLGFIVAALILIWAMVELGRWRYRRKKLGTRALTNWTKLDSTRPEALLEESLLLPDADDEDQEEKPEHDIHTRAQQNGHYSQSKKLL